MWKKVKCISTILRHERRDAFESCARGASVWKRRAEGAWNVWKMVGGESRHLCSRRYVNPSEKKVNRTVIYSPKILEYEYARILSSRSARPFSAIRIAKVGPMLIAIYRGVSLRSVSALRILDCHARWHSRFCLSCLRCRYWYLPDLIGSACFGSKRRDKRQGHVESSATRQRSRIAAISLLRSLFIEQVGYICKINRGNASDYYEDDGPNALYK